MTKYIEVEVPVLGKMVVPEDTNPTELLRAAGQQFGVDINQTISPLKSFSRGLERGGSGTARGFAQVDGYKESTDPVAPVDPLTDATMITPSGVTAEQQRNTDLRREFEYELAKLQGNKGAAMAGYALGTIFGDPVNLIGANATTVRAIATEAAIIGGVQGFFDPLYGTEDTMKNRAIGASVGTVGGGVLGFGLGKLLKKFDLLDGGAPKGAITKDAGIPDSADNVAKEINSDLTEGLPTPKVEAPTPTPAAQAADEVVPTPSLTQDPAPNVPTFLEGYDASLPRDLMGAAPRYGRNVVGFESDLDKALYIVANGAKRSKSDQDYLNWVKKTTGIADEQVLRQLGSQVRDIVKNTPDKGVIPRTNLALPDIQIAKPMLETPTAPFAGSVDKIGNSLNPESNVWVGLDNTSKNLYNIGRRFLEYDATGVMRQKLLPIEQKQAYDFMKAIDPNLTAKEMPDVFRSYAKVLDNLAEIRGNDFKAPSMEELMKNKISHEDFTELFNRGVFDGCAL